MPGGFCGVFPRISVPPFERDRPSKAGFPPVRREGSALGVACPAALPTGEQDPLEISHRKRRIAAFRGNLGIPRGQRGAAIDGCFYLRARWEVS
jgi:hypothetical protein